MEAHTALITYLTASPHIAYLIIFFWMFIEGDFLIFTAGFLIQREILHPLGTFLSIYLGVLMGDSAWFLIGRTDTTRHKVLHWLGRMTDVAGRRIDSHVKDRTFRSLLISKFVYGTHHFTLVRAGRLGVPFRKFFVADAIGSLIWMSIVGTIGYLTSMGFSEFGMNLKFLEVTLLVCILLYFIVSEIASRLLKKKL